MPEPLARFAPAAAKTWRWALREGPTPPERVALETYAWRWSSDRLLSCSPNLPHQFMTSHHEVRASIFASVMSTTRAGFLSSLRPSAWPPASGGARSRIPGRPSGTRQTTPTPLANKVLRPRGRPSRRPLTSSTSMANRHLPRASSKSVSRLPSRRNASPHPASAAAAGRGRPPRPRGR